MTSAGPDAFAACLKIETGEWDRYLLQMSLTIDARRRTPAYRRSMIADLDRLDRVTAELDAETAGLDADK